MESFVDMYSLIQSLTTMTGEKEEQKCRKPHIA